MKFPQLSLRELFLLVALVAMGCGSSPTTSKDQFVERTSQAGNSITIPSQWKSDDQGDTWLLDSPDGHARIAIVTNTVEGSGDLEQYSKTMLASLEPRASLEEIMAAGTKMEIGNAEATRFQVERQDQEGRVSWVYVRRSGDLYHLLIVTATREVMALNGSFYEQVVRTFSGINRLPN